MSAPLRAAILLIGDELLSGKIQESNGYFLIRGLRALGADVTELHMVSDQVSRIAEALNLVRHRNDVVFSCGGVGPTHDDRTFEAAAAAWGVGLEQNPRMEALLEATYGADAWQWGKLVWLPRGCELVAHEGGPWPCYRMENVYFFPGSPPYVAAHFAGLRPLLVREAKPIYLASLELSLPEGPIAALLTEAEARFAPVQIGSYPAVEPSQLYLVRVTLEARDLTAVEGALGWLRERLEPSHVLRVELPGTDATPRA